MYDIIIIGAGVVGSFIARELSKYDLKVLVLEKNNDVGSETTAANSAIIHSGYDPIPNTLKAKLNVLGNQMFDQICEELDVEFKRIGSLTLALNEADLDILKGLEKRAIENQVKVQLLKKEEVFILEPNLNKAVCGALFAPSAGIIDPFNLCVGLMENAINNGVHLILNTNVEKIDQIKNGYLINDIYETKVIINCAGIYADKINELINPRSFTIIPRRGEYLVLDHFKDSFIQHTLFTVPSAKGKGVLIAPTTSGNYLIGPSAEVIDSISKATNKEIIDNIKKQANHMVKDIPYYQVIRCFAGIRATPDKHEFIIEESPAQGFINVAGIESPGLASSPAIAKLVVEELVSKHFILKERLDYNPQIPKHIRIRNKTITEQCHLINQNHLFGNIICKCEKVSEAEIMDALNRSCPPHSVNGVKRRLRAGFGKCQGGMCQAQIVDIMAKHYQISKEEVLLENINSNIIKC